MPKRRPGIEIPCDWKGRDRHLEKLAQATGFKTVNRLLTFVAYEVSHCRTPGQLYKALSSFYENGRGRKKT